MLRNLRCSACNAMPFKCFANCERFLRKNLRVWLANWAARNISFSPEAPFYFIPGPHVTPYLLPARYFRLYDYGRQKNLQVYGIDTPPAVPLNATTSPCTFFALGNAAVVVTEVSAGPARAFSFYSHSSGRRTSVIQNIFMVWQVDFDRTISQNTVTNIPSILSYFQRINQ